MLDVINKTSTKVNIKKAQALASLILSFYKLDNTEVSLVIVGDRKMQSLNRDFRGINKTTDVLSFSGFNWASKVSFLPAESFLGEIFININEASRRQKYKTVFQELYPQEKGLRSKEYIFYFLLAHGLLHLVGYNDASDKSRLVMMKLGEQFLNRFFPKKVL